MNKTILGIMSGTSCDGLDLALVNFTEHLKGISYRMIKAESMAYSDEWVGRLKNCTKLDGLSLITLHKDFAQLVALHVNSFLENVPEKPDHIAFHGHTVFHQPQVGITYQTGDGAALAALTRIPVVCDFRTVDVALGGQGAPLVPIGDRYLFNKYGTCLNLGGFANVSYEYAHKRMAYDICPVNIVVNKLMEPTGFKFDEDGAMARKGKMIDGLYSKLMALDYYQKPAPKSLGIEWVNQQVFPVLNGYNVSLEDKLHTFYQHCSGIIASDLDLIAGNDVLITGGGAHNTFLIELINQKTHKNIAIPDKQTVDFKEAIIFAFLGYLYLQDKVNCLASVTGAKHDNIGGCLYKAVQK